MRMMGKNILGMMMGIVLFLFFPSLVLASGISPGIYEFSDTFSESSSVNGSVAVSRSSNEIGDLHYTVRSNGDCENCISSSGVLDIPADTIRVSFPFTFTPGNLSTGPHVEYLYFLLQDSSSPSGATVAAVQVEIAMIIRFSVVNSSDSVLTTYSGGGGGKTSNDNEVLLETVPSSVPSSVISSPSSLPVPSSDVSLPATPSSSVSPSPSPSILPSSHDQAPSLVPPPLTVFSYDYNRDSLVNSLDVSALIDDYFFNHCGKRCDANGDYVIDLKDIVNFSKYISLNAPLNTSGSLFTNDVIFYTKKVREQGKYQFVLTSSFLEDSSDSLAFALYADTGPSGLFASDLELKFDPTMFQFIGSDMFGSVFPVTQSLIAFADKGYFRIVAASGTPFIGIDGYIGTVYFKPLQLGSTDLTFQRVNTYSGGSSFVGVTKKNITGIITVPQVSSGVTTVSSSTHSSCGCFSQNRLPLCLSLLLGVFFSILAFLCLLKK